VLLHFTNPLFQLGAFSRFFHHSDAMV